jgi:hypothetical protein
MERDINDLTTENENLKKEMTSEISTLKSKLKTLEKKLELSEQSEHRLSEKNKQYLEENASIKAKLEDSFRLEYLEKEKIELESQFT